MTWNLEGDGAIRRVRLEWREIGVVMPQGARRRKGYGSELIERALPYLGGSTKLEFGVDGVRCELALPVLAEEKHD